MKNAFCFIWKVVFVLKIFKFCPNIFGHVVKWLVKKNKLISKFMTSSTTKQIITMHILPTVSRSKVNQTSKFGQLIECNVRKNFLRARLHETRSELKPV